MCPDDTDEDGATSYVVDEGRELHGEVAEAHAALCLQGGDPFHRIEICVSDGTTVHRYTVTVDYEPTFSAIPYIAGFGRGAAELFAIGDVEQMYRIGLHCPETLKRWAAGGDRRRPRRRAA